MRRLGKKYFYAIPVCVALLSAITAFLFVPYPSLRAGYEKFQIPLFTGFLTIGGFLLSLKTFIVVKMNEAVYQSDEYLKTAREIQVLDPNFDPMSGLKNLSNFLLFCVKWSLSSSFLQLSLGLISNSLTTAICIGTSAGAACLVLAACFLIRENMEDLFSHWKKASAKSQQRI